MLQFIFYKHAPCPTCGGAVYGRKDKRFCTLKCKNEHHNAARSQVNYRFKHIHKRFHRNLVVMEGVVGRNATKVSVHRDELFRMGFDIFTCSKSYRKNRHTVYELGDYEYYVHKNGIVTIRRTGELMDVIPIFFKRWEIELDIWKQSKKYFTDKMQNTSD